MKNDLITWNRHKREYLLNISGLVNEEIEPALKSCIENFYSLGIHRLNVNFGNEKGLLREKVLKELITNPLIETYEVDKSSVTNLEKEGAVIIKLKDNSRAPYGLGLDELDAVMQKGDLLFKSLLAARLPEANTSSRGAGELTGIFNAVYKAAPGTLGLLKWFILLSETGSINRDDYSLGTTEEDIMEELDSLKYEPGYDTETMENFLMLARSFCLRRDLLNERINVAILALSDSAAGGSRLSIKHTIDSFLKKIR